VFKRGNSPSYFIFPLSFEGGNNTKRKVSKDEAYSKEKIILKRSLKGRSPFNNYNSPSPYQGEGDKGDRVINYP